ncbi:MAG: LysR family transcriptional regulator [Solirubrobacteraceae bacterium]|jgi:hypothetical protein
MSLNQAMQPEDPDERIDSASLAGIRPSRGQDAAQSTVSGSALRLELPGDISLRLLRYFLVLSVELHFGRAAGRLGMSQPALSRAIMALERQLDTRVIDRNGGRAVRLTSTGVIVADHAARLLDEQRLMFSELNAIGELTVRPRLRSAG